MVEGLGFFGTKVKMVAFTSLRSKPVSKKLLIAATTSSPTID
jgi:hypothetical protein